ncbi:MAG TPA: HAD hydrolase-like protein [Candidatus Binataceae bacterium]|nr:HAD hydrolase-like protein [Candidatus Binataceae bacterium]
MAREFKGVFFDLDGTLVDIHGPLYVASRNALRDIGYDPDLSRERFYEAIARDDPYVGLPEHQRPDYFKLAFAYLVAELDRTERLEVLPHVHETLAGLKQRGYATAVITSRPGDSQRLVEKLAMVGLAPHIDQVLTESSATLRALDKTDNLRHAAARAAILPQACMYVGDEPRDIMAAGNAGYGAAVAVATGVASAGFLREHPQHRPDHVMHSIGELLPLLNQLKTPFSHG